MGKGYIPGRFLVEQLLAVVRDVAAVPVKDVLSARGEREAAPRDGAPAAPPTLKEADARLRACRGGEAELVKALLVRRLFGGMPGDVAMLGDFAELWLERFSGRAGPPPEVRLVQTEGFLTGAQVADRQREADWMGWLRATYAQGRGGEPPAPVRLADVGPLRREDAPTAAVDFHCSDVLEEALDGARSPGLFEQVSASLRQHGEAGQEVFESLRRAMWLFRSGVNCRQEAGSGKACSEGAPGERARLQPAWALVAKPVERLSQRHLDWRFQ